MSATVDFLRDTITDFVEPDRKFTLQELISHVSDPWDDVFDGRTSEDSREACVRADLQTLRDEDFLTFVDYDGTYSRNSTDAVDPNDNIFSLELLEKHGRILGWQDKTQTTNVEGITFKKWIIADKNEVMSHSIARELGIACQTRVDQALFPETQREIRDSVKEDGYDYHSFQPAISELSEWVTYKGNVYKYIVRDGNNRYELPWNKFPCALIEGENEYSLLQYGAMSNNPTQYKKNDITSNDVKYMIRLGFEYEEIEKTEDAVMEVLKVRYKETRKKDRRIFAAEILKEEGVQVSIEPYDITKAKKHLEDENLYDVELGEYDYVVGWGRHADHYRKFYSIFEERINNPDVDMIEYALLEMGKGVATQPTEENIRQQRIDLESERKKYINHCCDVADAHRSGQLKYIQVEWLAQANNKERPNEFQ